ncbi:hypothetical protein D3C72_1792010 [compost metagenome]
MSKGIINGFKIIKINESNAKRSLIFELSKMFDERMTVRQPCERIMVRQQRELLLVLLLFGHINVSARDLERISMLIPFTDAPAI